MLAHTASAVELKVTALEALSVVQQRGVGFRVLGFRVYECLQYIDTQRLQHSLVLLTSHVLSSLRDDHARFKSFRNCVGLTKKKSRNP